MYELTQLFWYKPIFMTELLLAEFLFSFRLKRRSYYYLRFTGSILLCYALAVAFPIPYYNAAYCSVMFLCFFVFTALQLKFCYKEPWANILFCSIAGYTVQHIAFITYDFIVNAAGINGDALQGIYGDSKEVYAPFANPLTELIYLFDFIIIYWLSFVIFGRQIKKNEPLQLKSTVIMIFVALVVIIEIVLHSVITYYEYDNYEKFYVVMLAVFNILCCFITLCFQFELPFRKKLENEVSFLNQLLNKTKEQYLLSKENIEMINLKCHDLKHQIRRIGSNTAIDGETLSEMENAIFIYDSAVKTGNEALDIILTEKSLLCRKNGIVLTCIADGAQLGFMKEFDIYSLFGNAIDNAIDAVIELTGDERNIGVTVRRIQTFLSINIHNYYDKVLEFERGLPKTTKNDTDIHGFGMKSIRMISEKYNGDMSVRGNNRVFNLNILFPLPEGGEK